MMAGGTEMRSLLCFAWNEEMLVMHCAVIMLGN